MHSHYLCFHITPHFNTCEIITHQAVLVFTTEQTSAVALAGICDTLLKFMFCPIGLTRDLWCALLDGALTPSPCSPGQITHPISVLSWVEHSPHLLVLLSGALTPSPCSPGWSTHPISSISPAVKCGEEQLCPLFSGGSQQGLNCRVIKVPIKRRGLTLSFLILDEIYFV